MKLDAETACPIRLSSLQQAEMRFPNAFASALAQSGISVAQNEATCDDC
jgi:hypothetical protein